MVASRGSHGVSPCSLSVQHKYTSIAEVQVHMEDEFLRSPLSGVSGDEDGMEILGWGHLVLSGLWLLAGLGGLVHWGGWVLRGVFGWELGVSCPCGGGYLAWG